MIADSQPAQPSTLWRTYLILAGGLAAVSLASVFIRNAQAEGLSSLVIAASRLGIAAVILTPITLRRYQAKLRQLTRHDVLLMGVSGLFLALHFILWITSLELTSILISVVLVSTTPLWSAVLEWVFLRARLTIPVIIGLLLAVLGGIVIGLFGNIDIQSSASNTLLGALYALGGAVAVAAYFVIGRSVRPKLPLLPYIWLVYGFAALVALLAVALNRVPVVGFDAPAYVWLLAIAIFPQLIGHSSYNYALKYLSATHVGVASQLEPVSSALLGFIVFREKPTSWQLVGSGIILAGVILATIGQSNKD